jgi:hypothetical protein
VVEESVGVVVGVHGVEAEAGTHVCCSAAFEGEVGGSLYAGFGCYQRMNQVRTVQQSQLFLVVVVVVA